MKFCDRLPQGCSRLILSSMKRAFFEPRSKALIMVVLEILVI